MSGLITEIDKKSGIVKLYKQGAPSVLGFERETTQEPGAGQVRVKQEAIGLNFVDTYYRDGKFPVRSFPYTPGVEAAGIIEAVGPWVTEFKVGDRVGYHFIPGAYAENRVVSTQQLVHIPDGITSEEAAAVMVKGFTARMLLKVIHPIKPGEVVLVHAAAGGVGTLVTKWAKALGATVIGTTGSEEKKEIILANGADYAFLAECSDFFHSVLDITGGKGVDVVFDGVGRDTFSHSLDLIRKGGEIVLYGSSSGQPEHIDHALLREKEIVMATPTLSAYIPDRDALEAYAADTFEALLAGTFGQMAITRYPLSQAGQAQADLEARKTIGSVILVP
ncbi:alcohol dehydrogenase [Dyadobacter beijingensis]|uniref:Alcohol dehydrogenase n=1 Tax=Dyadobacter beijingensis TaxID=365489 RepID=A0ABQ2IH73_9BACT|nr:quinone oxidoreductase [Dyadobacter beijingensis]GGN10222.1 alcohol dehydrogenase [Dyadobacter beijingensis]